MTKLETKILIARLHSPPGTDRDAAIATIAGALEAAHGSIDAAAEALEVSARTMWRWVGDARLLDRAAQLRLEAGAGDPLTRMRVEAAAKRAEKAAKRQAAPVAE